KSAKQTYAVNIPSFVGGSTAFVGFTGGTAAVTSTQDILSWTFLPAPTAPSGLKAQGASSTSVSLTWTDTSTDAKGFQLDRAPDPGFPQKVVTQNLPGTPDSFADTAAGLVASGTYYYRIRAVDAAGASANSGTATVTLPTPPLDFSRGFAGST